MAEAGKEGEVPSGGGIAREGYLGQGRKGKRKGEKEGNVRLTKGEKRPRTLKTHGEYCSTSLVPSFPPSSPPSLPGPPRCKILWQAFRGHSPRVPPVPRHMGSRTRGERGPQATRPRCRKRLGSSLMSGVRRGNARVKGLGKGRTQHPHSVHGEARIQSRRER